MNYIPFGLFTSGDFYENTKGVFKIGENFTPIGATKISPLHFKATMTKEIRETLQEYGVKGYFFVRQKRLPITVCQGLSIGIDGLASIPMVYDEKRKAYVTERFFDDSRSLNQNM